MVTTKKVMAKYANPVVLILDEWLLLKPTNAEQRDIFELLHRRRKKSSTIFCSQYAFEEWYEQLGGGDSPLAAAIIDRIAHDSYRINITSIDAEHDRSMREVYGLEYPIITKAAISTIGDWKKDVFICNSPEELEEAFKHIRSSRVMLQKYIHKKNELALEAVSANKGTNMCIAIASTYNYLLPDTYSPYMTVTNFCDEELKNKLKSMIREIGFEGIMEVEFLIDQDGKLYFGEINFRNSTWSYAATCAGMPLPIMWIAAMENHTLLEDMVKEVKDGFTAMVELYDYRARVKTKKLSVLKWFKELQRADCKYYIGKHDWKPVFAWTMQKLTR